MNSVQTGPDDAPIEATINYAGPFIDHPLPSPAQHPMPPRSSARVSSHVDVLSHLKTCPKCGYFVGAPVMCKGQSNPAKKGFWFEKVRLT